MTAILNFVSVVGVIGILGVLVFSAIPAFSVKPYWNKVEKRQFKVFRVLLISLIIALFSGAFLFT
jgi:hypothetical protein